MQQCVAPSPTSGRRTSEGVRDHATSEELAELALDKVGQAAAVGPLGGIAQEGLEVLADETVEDGALGRAGLVDGATHDRRASQRRAGAPCRRIDRFASVRRPAGSCSPRTSPPCSRTPCPPCRVGKSPPAERAPRAAAAVARGVVRLVARRGAEGDAGEQAGTARRTVSLRGAPAMVPGPGTTGHADCPGLVRRIADLAIVTAPAGALHVAGLAGAFAAAATVADGMVRVAARALALARRRVAGHADRAVTVRPRSSIRVKGKGRVRDPRPPS